MPDITLTSKRLNNYFLKFLSSCDNILLDEVLKDNTTMKEIKKKLLTQILENHKQSIYYSKTENAWRTYLFKYNKDNKKVRYAVKRKSREELEIFLAEYYLEQNSQLKRENITLQEAFEEWLLFRRDSTSVKTKTIKENVFDWNRFFKDTELANSKIKNISSKMLRQFFTQLTKDRKYTYKRVSNARSILSGIFFWAIEEDILEHNPLSDVNFKRFSYKPVEDQTDNVFSEQDVKKLLSYLQEINDDPYALAIQLAFNLFIRIGELKAIKFDDVDFDNRTVYLHSQVLLDNDLEDDLSFSKRKVVISDQMKGYTSKGYRQEYLTDQAICILKKAKQLNPNGTLVFEPFGKPMLTDTFNERLKKYCNECGIPYHSSHKIRFYCASTAYDGYNLVTISKLMGHSQVATTIHYLRNVNKGNDSIHAFDGLGLH